MSHPAGEVIDALVAALGLVPELAEVRILDGPPTSRLEDPDLIAVGLEVVDNASASGDSQPGYGGARNESFDVSCLAQAWSGETEVAPRRRRALDLLDLARAVLVADPQVGDTCSWARITRWSCRVIQDESGCMALAEFVVRVDARRFDL